MTLISLFGVESTGKTALGRRLASYYGALFLPEFGRTWCEIFGTDCSEEDLIEIATNQHRNIDQALEDRNFVVSDTDALQTACWAQMMIGHVPPMMLQQRKSDLYLYCCNDTPFVPDGLRIYGDPARRDEFDKVCRRTLEASGVNFVEVGGNWEDRFHTAVEAVEKLRASGR